MIFLFFLGVSWALLFFFDLIFKTCMFHPYISMLSATGIVVSPFMFVWTTNKFNRWFYINAQEHALFFRIWFSLGKMFVYLTIMPASILFICSMYRMIFQEGSIENSTSLLVPIAPGMNMPLNHLPYYFLVLLLSSIYHEVGHALASCREHVEVINCGFGVYAVLPFAFTNIDKERLQVLSSKQKLNIFCAGIWHNIVLCLIAVMCLTIGPYLLAPFYYRGRGVTVMQIGHKILGAESAALSAGDEIHSVNDCKVTDIESWETCLEIIDKTVQHGFCVTESFVLHEDMAIDGVAVNYCCDPNSTKHLCFEFLNKTYERFACLPARTLLENTTFCCANSDCPKQSLCLRPANLKQREKFMQIHRKNDYSVIYMGSVTELKHNVRLTGFTLHWFPVDCIEIYETFFGYLLLFSSGYAVFNLLPCRMFDGALISEVLIQDIFAYIFRKRLISRFTFSQQGLQNSIIVFQKCFTINVFLAIGIVISKLYIQPLFPSFLTFEFHTILIMVSFFIIFQIFLLKNN